MASEREEDAVSEEELAAEELFDPSILPDKFIVEPPDLRAYDTIQAADVNDLDYSNNTAAVVEDSSASVPGYRIQIFSSSSYTRSNELFQTVRLEILEEHVYLIYDAPFYKIRVGNFLDRDGAEDFRLDLRSDYPDSWIVRTEVFPYLVPPSAILSDSLLYIDSTMVDTTLIFDTTTVNPDTIPNNY
ncbi:MAG: SPOR domain-containing protein [bacterium]|nr:SPOR domain-containing protein [bacterium]